MSKKYIVVKNQHGEFAPKNTETGTVFGKEKTFEEAKRWADKWNSEAVEIWTPVETPLTDELKTETEIK